MLAAIQYSAAEIAIGAVVWLVACGFMVWLCEGTLFDRHDRD